MSAPPLMTAAEVAEYMRLSVGAVYRHASGECQPQIPSVKMGKSVRFERESIEEFVRSVRRRA